MSIFQDKFRDSAANIPSIDIIIDLDAYNAVLSYAQANPAQELTGVLVGTSEQHINKATVCIKGVIDTGNNGVKKISDKFNAQTWEYINSAQERYFPDDKIVGWFNIRPGSGGSTNQAEMSIYRKHFSLPWQVAFILDAVTGENGFFCWQGNTVVQCSYAVKRLGFANGGYVLKPVVAVVEQSAVFNLNKGKLRLGIIVFLITALVAAVSYYIGMEKGKTVEQAGAEVQQSSTELTPKSVKQATAPPAKAIYQHQIRPGENLWDISQQYYYSGYGFQKIAEYNKLTNPRELVPGQILLIPDAEKNKDE